MAITPRTILTSAAPATVAVVSLYFFTVLGTAAFTTLNKAPQPSPMATNDATQPIDSSACDHVANRFGADTEEWTEYAWANYVHCFERRGEAQMAIRAADQGLEHFPNSETLFNRKGIQQSLLKDYAGAVDTLSTGMDRVKNPRTGQMANNLAWASLWEPRLLRLEEARGLYISALARSPHSCEIIHTGLFVEFALSQQAHGLERFDSLERFGELRARYNRCLDRLEEGQWHDVVELVGAAVLFDNVDSAHTDSVQPLMRSAVRVLQRDHGDVSIAEVCNEAMPLDDFHHQCVDAISNAIDARAALESRHQQRNDRAAQVRIELVEDLQNNGDRPVHLRLERTHQAPAGCSRSAN